MKNSKGFVIALFTIITIFFTFTCYAALPDEAFAAEKLVIGDYFGTAPNLYGEPVSVKNLNDKSTVYYFQTPNGKIGAKMGEDKTIEGLFIYEGNCKTAAGIQVGSTLANIKNTYGTPDVETDYVYPKEHVLIYKRPLGGRLVKSLKFGLVNNLVKSIMILKVYET